MLKIGDEPMSRPKAGASKDLGVCSLVHPSLPHELKLLVVFVTTLPGETVEHSPY